MGYHMNDFVVVLLNTVLLSLTNCYIYDMKVCNDIYIAPLVSVLYIF